MRGDACSGATIHSGATRLKRACSLALPSILHTGEHCGFARPFAALAGRGFFNALSTAVSFAHSITHLMRALPSRRTHCALHRVLCQCKPRLDSGSLRWTWWPDFFTPTFPTPPDKRPLPTDAAARVSLWTYAAGDVGGAAATRASRGRCLLNRTNTSP